MTRGRRAVCAILGVMLLSGCTIRQSGEAGESSAVSPQAEEYAAAPENGAQDMAITRADYLGEYLYYLARSGYGTDTDEETLKQAQQTVINSMIEDRIIRAKFAENGLELTESDRADIEKEVGTGIASMLDSIKSAAAAADDSLTDEELTAQAQEQYQQILDTCGVTEDIFTRWQETLVMKRKLTDKLCEAECTDDEAGTRLQALIAAAKTQYESDPAKYSAQDFAAVWIPEGTREIQGILVGFDYDTYSAIVSLRDAGSNDEADALRQNSLDSLQERYERVMSGVVAGEDFAELMEKYNEDEGNVTILVTPGTEVYGSEILECAMGIDAVGGTDTAVTDYGYYVLRYAADAEVTDQQLSDITEELRGYITENKQEEEFSALMDGWKTEYSYQINEEQLAL